MKKVNLELAVGVFILLGIFSLAYISIKLGKLQVIGGAGYTVYAEFSNVGGVSVGSSIEIAGVQVGRVTSVRLKDYEALVGMSIEKGVKLQDDSIASVRTKGLIGEKFIMISPGASEKYIPPGGRIRDTEPAVDIEELISKFAFGKV
jgi:phospholipid/cholesterol/gamma-HCH transport system substrate-binding protein